MEKLTYGGMVLNVPRLIEQARLATPVHYNKGNDKIEVLPLDQAIVDERLKEPLAVMRENVITVIGVSNPQMHRNVSDAAAFNASYLTKHLLKKCIDGQQLDYSTVNLERQLSANGWRVKK